MSKAADQIYLSFLVRCWLIPAATNDEPPTWRFELREVSAEAHKQHFSNLEQMKAFLAEKLAALTESSKQNSDKADGRIGGEI